LSAFTVAASYVGASSIMHTPLTWHVQVVFGPGKSPDQIATMMQSIITRQRVALATRIDPDMYAAVRKIVPGESGASDREGGGLQGGLGFE
jgi:hypothetical protein